MNVRKLRSHKTTGPLRTAALTLAAGLILPAAQAQSRARPASPPPMPVIAPRSLPAPRPAPVFIPRPALTAQNFTNPSLRARPPLGSGLLPPFGQRTMPGILTRPGTGLPLNPNPLPPPVLGSQSGAAALNRFNQTLEGSATRSRPNSQTNVFLYSPGLYGLGGIYGPVSPFTLNPYGYNLYGNYPYGTLGYPYGYVPPVTMPAPVIPPTDQYGSPYGYPYVQPYIYTEQTPENRAEANQKLDPALRKVANDIRQAWLKGSLDLLAPYLRRDAKILVQGSGNQDTTESAGDFLDALRKDFAQKTVDFAFDPPEPLKPDVYLLIGHRTIRDAQGDEQTTLIAYTLQKMDGQFYITQVQTY